MKPKFLALFLSLIPVVSLRAQGPELPEVAREFRAIWVATVANIDWPSKPGLSAWQQQAELIAILDKAVSLNMNAIVLQVRPAADALYPSKLEPWSEYLTGQMGRPPEPYYDPLEFAVTEAHKRGLELHAWFNPYRAHAPSGKSVIAATHVSNERPDLVRTYGGYLWLDPGDSAVRRISTNVVVDVVRRYDVDGVHIDDYFYPYKEKDSQGKVMDFPDDRTWKQYVASGGQMSRNDWRRRNVDVLIRDLYTAIKSEKRWVKFGVSPFGIWRPGNPEQIKGFDAYSELYADSRKWLNEGWVDYFTPQLYWAVNRTDQSYPVLLRWWVSQNTKSRNIWPGNFTSKVGESGANAWKAQEILDQISATRMEEGATGNVHFSAKVLMLDCDSLNEKLVGGPYAGPALVPPSPWLDSIPPSPPKALLRRDSATGEMAVDLMPQGTEKVWRWVVRYRTGTEWTTLLLPGAQLTHMFAAGRNAPVPTVAVSAVDRTGNESAIVLAQVGNSTVLPALNSKAKPKTKMQPAEASKPRASTRKAKRTGRKKKG
ncbi:MAG: family 10 glycosylhydrolase [Gemmatimonadaceae bacterium]